MKASAQPAGSAASLRYNYRRLLMTELPLLNELYNRCYQSKRPLEEAQWLYKDNPNGEAVITAAFDDNNQLLGMRPAIAWKVFWRGRERIAYQFTDALVAPDHRGRGIFTHLVKLICEWADQNDCALFSSPNDNSLPIYLRTSLLQILGPCEVWVKPISWPRYIAYMIGLGAQDNPAHTSTNRWELALSDGDVSFLPTNRFESDFEQIHSELANRALSFTLRRKEFLNWRYFGSPVRQYRVALVERRGRIQGYLVIRMINGIAHVIDVFLAPDLEMVRKCFRLLTDWAKQMGAIAIHFKASEGSFFSRAFSECGYWGKKRPGSIVLDRKSAQLLAACPKGPLDIREFYFVMGDFDFY